MRVVHVSAHDLDGGAARSAFRLHCALRQQDVFSAMLVGEQTSDAPDVHVFQPPSDELSRLLRFARRKNLALSRNRYRDSQPKDAGLFSDDRSEHQAAILQQIPPCDVIHLHWIAGLFDYRAFLPSAARRAPLVWTLHDMNPFTGGCHYNAGCSRFAEGCGDCPQLGSSDPHDLSRAVWRRKQAAFGAIPPGRLHIVTPSKWLAREAGDCPLLRGYECSIIPYGVDTIAFAPRERGLVRKLLRIPQESRVLVFAAHWLGEPRKGYSLLAEALRGFSNVSQLLLLTVGKNGESAPMQMPHHHLGTIEDEEILSAIYSAADLFLLPTLQDNLPNTLLESLACGTPVVGFRTGGVEEALEDGITGSIVESGDAAGLGRAVRELLESPGRLDQMRENCRRRALSEYSLDCSATRYMNLYTSLCRANQMTPATANSE